MSVLHASVLTAFKQRGWAYRSVADAEVIEADFEAHHTKVCLHVQSFGESGVLSVVADASFPVPRTHFLAVSELLMRTNKVLNLGNFELDWDEGRVMFRVSNLFQPNRVDERIVSGLVYAAVAEMDEQIAESKVHAAQFAATLRTAQKRFAALAKVEERHANHYRAQLAKVAA